MIAEAELNAAELDLLNGELHRRSLVDYVRDCYPSFELADWQVELCDRLQMFVERIEDQKSPRIMVHVPPQCGKTTIVSRAFIAWVAGLHPEWDGIMASYAQSMSRKNSRWVRNRLRNEDHQRYFPKCRLAEDSQSIEDMNLTTGCQIISRGIGGGSSGNPAMWVVVDDPFADRAAAESMVIRDNVEDWYTGTAIARLGPGAGVLIMHTRWHLDDLCGRLLKKAKDGKDDELVDKWEEIVFPAEWTKDAPRKFYGFDAKGRGWLQGRFRPQDLQKKKANLPPRDWLSLFQQTPVQEGGSVFETKWINTGTPQKKFTYLYQAWDVAVTAKDKERGDYSVGVCVGKDTLGRYWLIDVERGQWNSAQLVQKMMAFAKKHPSTQRIWVEGGPIGRAIEPWLRDRIKETGALFQLEIVPHSGRGDKVVRTGPVVAAMANGSFYVPTNAKWLPDLTEELGLFPYGLHDDQVDALALLFLEIQQVRESHPDPVNDGKIDPTVVSGSDLDDYYRKLADMEKTVTKRHR
jgi:predicted phage terminase large subunit-like protein